MSTFDHPLVRLTRIWLAAYTSGLPSEAKLRRRAEIESDIWEQLSDAQFSSWSALHVAARCVLGIPADLTWRLHHSIMTGEGRRGSIMNSSVTGWTYVFAGASLMAIASALAIVIVDNLQYSRGEEYIVPSDVLVMLSFTLLALSLTGIVAGFSVMPHSPDLGAALAIAGSLTGGLLFFWLILPPLVGVAISVYAFSRAQKIRSRPRD